MQLLSEAETNAHDGDSVYSEFDLVNDTIQEILLLSSSDDEESELHCFGSTFFCTVLAPAPPLLHRRREAKKAKRSSSRRSSTTATSAGSAFLLGPKSVQLKKKICTSRNSTRALLPALQPTRMGVPVGPLSIVLDLDETLVYARQGPIFVRPFVKEFLDICEELRCEIIVWTAGVPDYVNPILHAIADTCCRKNWFHHIISRHRRWYSEWAVRESCPKDLRLLRRSLDRLLLIENNPVSIALQPSHAILVEDYLQPNERDETFRVLGGVLRSLVSNMTPASGCLETAILEPSHSVTDAMDREVALAFALLPLAASSLNSSSENVKGNSDSSGSSKKRSTRKQSASTEEESLIRCRSLLYSPTSGERRYGCLQPIPEGVERTQP